MRRDVQHKRFLLLLDVLGKHQRAKGQPAKLNGIFKTFHMAVWNCDTAACAFGSYTLTPYGKRFFVQRLFGTNNWYPELRKNSDDSTMDDAARHFGITVDEAFYLFDPSGYPSPYDVTPAKVRRRVLAVMRDYGLEAPGRTS